MTEKSKLIEINNLIKKNGLWVPDRSIPFNYTDGSEAEFVLKKIVSKAHDLSSQSIELEKSYPDWDWVTEYHLSYKRANLLRGLELSKIDCALEIGSGCGAITRYLGEMGIRVDAIEGAKRRAEISQLRCRDMGDQINIINANYNDLRLPKKTYDAIFIIGVIEYAGKFLSKCSSDEAAVVSILTQLRMALKESGVMILAIENRNGLKYWLGATEDHYGEPYIGLTNYWGQSGTKTYDYKKWPHILQNAGISHWRFMFPFPDYKLPQVILDNDFIDNDKNAYSLLYRINSRDYLKPWQPGTSEFAIWRSLHQNQQLQDYANSFLILAGTEESCISKVAQSDFIYFSGGSRKAKYRTVTIKKRGRNEIIKKPIFSYSDRSNNFICQEILKSKYITGKLLSTIWIEAVLDSETNLFKKLLEKYFLYIKDILDNGSENSLIDALPANIIANELGDYEIIDQEWKTHDQLTAEFIFFRALLWFGHDNSGFLANFFKNNKINRLSDFIGYGFKTLSIDHLSKLNDFTIREESIQFETSGQKNLHPIRSLIDIPLTHKIDKHAWIKIYWADDTQAYSNNRSHDLNYSFQNSLAKINCKFFSNNKISKIKILPLLHSNETKLIFLNKVDLYFIGSNSEKKTLIWHIGSEEDDYKYETRYNQFVLPLEKAKRAYIANGPKAAIEFSGRVDTPSVVHTPGLFEIEIEITGDTALGPSFCTEYLSRQIDTTEKKNHHLAKQVTDKNNSLNIKDNEILVKTTETYHLKAKIFDITERMRGKDQIIDTLTKELEDTRKFLDQLAKVKLLKYPATVMPGKYSWITDGLTKYNRFQFKQSEYNLIKNSNLFDEEFYLEYQPDLSYFNGDPLKHFLLLGGFRGLKPCLLFDTPFYIKQCPELVTDNINPLVHFLSKGADEGKNPCFLFDTKFYLGNNQKVADSGKNPLCHYIIAGGKKGLNPHPLFDTHYYCENNPDVLESSLTPLEHYLVKVNKRNLSPNALFDIEYYLKVRPTLKDQDISAFRHFIEFGYKEGGDPSLFFNTAYYFNSDLNDFIFKVNPIAHYNTKGQYESRSPSQFFDLDFYKSQLDPHEKVQYSDIFTHYIVRGEKERKNPHPLIDIGFYKKQLNKINLNPNHFLKHFIEKKLEDGCSPHPLFDPGYCMAQLKPDELQPDRRLLEFVFENKPYYIKDPHPLFDTEFYRELLDSGEPDIENPLIHYAKNGAKLGCSTHPLFDVSYYTKDLRNSVLNKGENPIVHYIYKGSRENRWPSLSIEMLPYKPKMGLFLFIERSEFDYLSSRILCVFSQLYPCWQLTVVVCNPDESIGYRYAKALAADDYRINWIEIDRANDAGELFNEVIKNNTNDYIIFLGKLMFLKAHALLSFVRQLNLNPDLCFIHSERNDNDFGGIHIENTDNKMDTMVSRFFIGPLACFKYSVIEQMGGFDIWYQSAYDNNFLTEYLHRAENNRIEYIADILHHTLFKDPTHVTLNN